MITLPAGAAGAALAAAGLWWRDKAGMLAGAAGPALLARAVTDAGLERRVASVVRGGPAGNANGVSIPVRIGPRPDQPHGRGSTGPVSDRVH